MRQARYALWALPALVALALAACGLGVQSADLFLLTRSGEGRMLTLLVNDGGTVRCSGGPARRLPDPLLLQARDLASELDGDAKHRLRLPPTPRSVFFYTVRLQDGSISFPDTAAARRQELAQAELFTVRTASQACGSR